MINKTDLWDKYNSPILDDIKHDLDDYKSTLLTHFQIKTPSGLHDSLRSVHMAISLLNGYGHDAFFNQPDISSELHALSIHLLNRAIISSFQGDYSLSRFALRGSLELTGKEMALLNSKVPRDKFSNNLEENISSFKKTIFSRADLRTQSLKNHNYPLTHKKRVKASFKKIVDYGREELYGNLSEAVHFRVSINDSLATTLVEMSKSPATLSSVKSSLNLVLKVSTYELFVLQLNDITTIEKRISFPRQELIDFFFRESDMPLIDDFNNVLKFSREFL